MKRSAHGLLVLILILLNACAVFDGGLSSEIAAATISPDFPQAAKPTSEKPVGEPSPAVSVEPVPVSDEILNEFGLSRRENFSLTQPPRFETNPVTNLGPALPVDLAAIRNIGVASGLTNEEQSALRENGFVVIETGEKQFSEARRQISKYYGQPYYLTTDAAFHALHLTFDELLKALEKEYFLPLMKELTANTLSAVREYRQATAGSAIDDDAALAEAYLSLGLKMFDPSIVLEPEIEKAIQAQMEQIRAENGRDDSALIPGFEDDYSAYRPVGHYAGDPLLENYFRGMTWFGRVQFQLSSDSPDFEPSRAPLIITLALRQKGPVGNSPAEQWGKLHEVLTMMIGPVDDGGPLEYAALMDEIYQKGHTIEDLKDEELWRQFVASRAALPAPQINSTFANSLSDLSAEHGWRFSGQRFTMDGFFLQNLVYDRVGTMENPRKLPSGLDVMAILGSEPAGAVLKDTGETAYDRYPEQSAFMKSWITGLPQEKWRETFYNSWLYAFLSQVSKKEAGFPPYMRTLAWSYRELNSALGSWAELKHDTSLYTKMPEYAAGGGPPSSGPAPAFVEPNPEVFYRMSFAIQNLADGLTLRGMNISLTEPQPGDFTYPAGVERLILDTLVFGERLHKLGDIAARELAGEALGMDDYEEIQSCLGPVECQVMVMQNLSEHGSGPWQDMPPVPAAAAVAGAEDKILQVGVGDLNRIYVIVPLEGGLQIAQGNVFSYYEFAHPRVDRLTDEAWRGMLAEGEISPPAWSANFLSQAGGMPVDVLAFRIGDWYLITEAGDDLNVRAQPGKQGALVGKLHANDYVEIVAGPEVVGGVNWWKIRQDWILETPMEGWVIEEGAWYERAHGQ